MKDFDENLPFWGMAGPEVRTIFISIFLVLAPFAILGAVFTFPFSVEFIGAQADYCFNLVPGTEKSHRALLAYRGDLDAARFVVAQCWEISIGASTVIVAYGFLFATGSARRLVARVEKNGGEASRQIDSPGSIGKGLRLIAIIWSTISLILFLARIAISDISVSSGRAFSASLFAVAVLVGFWNVTGLHLMVFVQAHLLKSVNHTN